MSKCVNHFTASSWPICYQNVKNMLNNSTGVKVGSLKFSDVMFDSRNCHCIYVFYEGDNYKLYEENNLPHRGSRCPAEGDNYKLYEENNQNDKESVKYWYIGSNVSKALVERLGGHFAPRTKDYANGLLKHIAYTITNMKERDWIWTDEKTLGNRVNRANKFVSNAFPIIKDLKLIIICFEENVDGELKAEIRKIERQLIKDFKPAFNYMKRNGNRKFVIKNRNGKTIKH